MDKVDSYYLNIIVKWMIDNYVRTEDNKVPLSGNRYLEIVSC